MTSERRSPMRRVVRLAAALLALAALVYAVVRVLGRRGGSDDATPTDWPPMTDPVAAPKTAAPNAASPPASESSAPPGATSTAPTPTVPESSAPAPATDRAGADTPWIESNDGACPVSHPVKGKLASGIFHVPGGLNYDRTKADRCYRTPDDATDDGLRASKR